MTKDCDSCKFYNVGMCHRYPPSFIEYLALEEIAKGILKRKNGKLYKTEPFEEVDDCLNWSHPAVDQEDWCGEWVNKEDDK